MSDNSVLFALALVFMLIISIYYIYKSNKEYKAEQEKINKERAENERKQKELRIKERKENSIKWNNKIQSRFKDTPKYKTSRPIKALVGDYTDSMAPYTNSMLRIMGIQTEIVPTASDIIERIESGNNYDIIITNNVYLRGESGHQVLDTLKKDKDFNIPIVILTVDQNARDKYLSQGFDDYIEKPLDEEKIKKTFTNLIEDLKFIKIKKQ